jgi:hypothetical protein
LANNCCSIDICWLNKWINEWSQQSSKDRSRLFGFRTHCMDQWREHSKKRQIWILVPGQGLNCCVLFNQQLHPQCWSLSQLRFPLL